MLKACCEAREAPIQTPMLMQVKSQTRATAFIFLGEPVPSWLLYKAQ